MKFSMFQTGTNFLIDSVLFFPRTPCIFMYLYEPLVLTPIQLRYLVSFFDMNVLPRAGNPTITKHVGTLAVKLKNKEDNI